MKEWESYWRIMQWNRLSDSQFSETDEVARQCRTAWKQISAIVPPNSRLPKEFLYPLRGYARNEAVARDLFNDERRLILCVSDLRDYLQLMRRQGRGVGS
jgi:hypothetical protein